MLDWLASKVAMTAAALLVLASIVTFFSIQREDVVWRELQNAADKIADLVNEAGEVEGETVFVVSFGSQGSSVLRGEIQGKKYSITFYRTYVLLEQEDRRAKGNLIYAIHLLKPDSTNYTAYEIDSRDQQHWHLTFLSGQEFFVERKLIDVNDIVSYETFLYFG